MSINQMLLQHHSNKFVQSSYNQQQQYQQDLLEKTQQNQQTNRLSQQQPHHQQQNKQILQHTNNIYTPINSHYLQQQQHRLRQDQSGNEQLSIQIQRIKKLGQDYKQKQKQINNLNVIVERLKNQNKNLKEEKQYLKEEKGKQKEKEKIYQKKENDSCLRNNSISPLKKCLKNGKDQIKEENNALRIQMGGKYNPNHIKIHQNRQNQHKSAQKVTSPQANLHTKYHQPTTHYQPSHTSYLNIHNFPHYHPHTLPPFHPTSHYLLPQHHSTKRLLISSFLQQLQSQLQQTQHSLFLQQQLHKQAKQNFQKCYEQLSQYKLRHNQENSLISKQNKKIKHQLEREIDHRLKVERKFECNNALLQRYYVNFVSQSALFDRQFDIMDQIFIEVQNVIRK